MKKFYTANREMADLLNGRREQAFTLIEVLVAIFILLVVIISFSLLFSDSFINIFASGYKSEAQYKLQDLVENKFLGVDKSLDGVSVSATNISGFSIEFSGLGTVSVNGDEYLVNTTFSDARGNQRPVNLTFFVPEGNN
jgi:prepilin-type N-terminal cleavage/methylation domain-containing protein